MLDQYSRNIDYIRISVTDRCNLRCIYCMPQTSKTYLRQEELLTYDEIVKLAGIYRSLGIKNVKLTGGEPLVREHVEELIFRLKKECGMEKVTLTTNGILLEQQLDGLVKAGLDGVNISLDTLNPEHYNSLTGGCHVDRNPFDGNLEVVLRGMRKAQKQAGISVKVNCVLMHQTREELLALAELAKDGVNVRFIELMPIGHAEVGDSYGFVSNQEILDRFPELIPADDEKFSVSKNYRLPDGKGKVGLISALSNHFCASCNKIRLTSDGKIKPCLHSNEEIDMKGPLRLSDEELLDALRASVGHKVEHHMLNEGAAPIERDMNKIGG